MRSLGPEQILNGFWSNDFDTLREQVSAGKSGSLFFFTKDQKYMMKTIPKHEFDKLRHTLQNYLEYLMENKDTFLTHYFGLHEVSWGANGSRMVRKYIVIMQNLFKDYKVGRRFDMKGSITNRAMVKKGMSLQDIPETVPLKCSDFRNHVKHLKFSHSVQANCTPLLQQLSNDAQFLESCNIIDYSVLLGELKLSSGQIEELRAEARSSGSSLGVNGLYIVKTVVDGNTVADDGPTDSQSVQERAYIIGVIDTLTGFDLKKKAEFGFKRCLYGNEMSCIPPHQYQQRFTKFMAECFSLQQTNVQNAISEVQGDHSDSELIKTEEKESQKHDKQGDSQQKYLLLEEE